MAFAPAGGEAALGAWTLVAAFGFVVCAGLLWTWRNTIGAVFAAIASFRVGLKWGPAIHPLAPLGKINTAVEHELSKWADKCQKQAGLAFHYMAVLYETMSREISRASAASLDFGHYVLHDYVPGRIERDLAPLRHRTKKAAAVAAAAAATAGLVKRQERAHEHSQTQANHVTKAHADTTAHEAHVVKHAVKSQALGGTIALPRPVAWPSFRRAWNEIKEWQHVTGKRLAYLETLLAASGLALAVARMTGTSLSCWRGQGNIARALRHVCGVPKWLLDLLILGAVEAFIASDLCGFSDLLIKQAEAIRPALLELVDVEDALIGCHGTTKPLVFALPAATLPPLQGVSPLAA